MRFPILPPAAERTARKYFLPVIAFLHLSSFHALPLENWTTGWVASAFAVSGILLFRDFGTSRREHRIPDVLSHAAWGAAGLLELHALFPLVASSRIVPAVLFPAFSFLLPAFPAGVSALVSLAWLCWSPSLGFAGTGTSASIALMAALGMAGGRVVKNRLTAQTGRQFAQEPPGLARSLVVPRENPGESGPGNSHGGPEGYDILTRREDELREGIQRVLEGILPIAGADRILYVIRSHQQGSPLVARNVTPSGDDAWHCQEIPETYVPLREALVFRREFFADWEEAARWGLPRGGGPEKPSGIASVPVLSDGIEEGAILAFRFGEGRWVEPVVPVLQMGAFFIAREITETRRRYRRERVFERQVGFNRLAGTIAEAAEKSTAEGVESASPRRMVYKTAAEQIRFQLHADRVLLLEADERKMRGRVVWETVRRGEDEASSEPHDEDAWVRLAGTYSEWVLKNNIHRIFSGVRTFPVKHPILPPEWAREDEEAYLLSPFEGAGGFRGILVCASRDAESSYHKRDTEMVLEILTIMRMGISHALHIETLEEQATSDGLTKLLNQRTFLQRLSIVLERLDSRHACAVIMADIDHFKRVNDTYGHPAGDEVLKNVANIIRKTVRKADIAARYGGEEFVLYLDHADEREAIQVSERLRLIIEQTRFEFGGREVVVTASLGIACYPSDGKEIRELLGHADEALYRSKQEGRNRTTVYRRPA